MTSFVRHAALLFLALRAGDLVNLAVGMWLVPTFIAPETLGAVLPVTTFATVLVLPVFAFATAVMKESADLAGRGRRGALASLWRGVFVAMAILALLCLGATALLLPRYLVRMHVTDASAGFFILASALLGAVAPVYTDALQAIKRFRALGVIECLSALARFVALVVLMPLRAFAGFFAGNALQPLMRIAASVFVLRRDLAVPSERWWTRENVTRLSVRFALVFLYLATTLFVSSVELDFVRHDLASVDSAAYFLVTRLTDLMNYLTYPLLIVLFPYAAEASRREAKGGGGLVLACSAITLVAAVALGGVYALWGRPILALLPNGGAYTDYLRHVPILLAITALTACPTFYTQAEVAAGRFTFLWWLLPLNVAYVACLKGYVRTLSPGTLTLGTLLAWFVVGAALRFACAALAMAWRTKAR